MLTKEELLLELEKRPIPEELLELKERTTQRYNEFFNMVSHRKFQIYIIHTREEMDIAAEKKTADWLAGYSFGQKGQIFLFDPECYNKETGRTLYNIRKLLKHEMAHLYFGEITKANKPKWLNEGLAEYLAKKNLKEITIEDAVNGIDYDVDFTLEQYTKSHKLVDFLITKFGKEKLLLLLRSYHNPEEFFSAFQNIYGFELTKEKLIENLKV